MGLLTIKGEKYGMTQLVIPNYVIRTIYWEYIGERLRKEHKLDYDILNLRKVIWKMAYEGNLQPYLDFVKNQVLNVLSNRDLIRFEEKNVKMILLTLLAQGKYYKPISEYETELGYIDILLEKDIRFSDVKYEWIWELKYLKKSEKDQLDRVKQEGLTQLEKYAKSRQFENKEFIKKALIIFIGKDDYEVIIPSE